MRGRWTKRALVVAVLALAGAGCQTELGAGAELQDAGATDAATEVGASTGALTGGCHDALAACQQVCVDNSPTQTPDEFGDCQDVCSADFLACANNPVPVSPGQF